MQFSAFFSVVKFHDVSQKSGAGREISSAFVEVDLLEMCAHLLHNGLVSQHQDSGGCKLWILSIKRKHKTAFMNSSEKEIKRTDKKVKIKLVFNISRLYFL